MDPKTRCIIQTISVGKYPISLHAVGDFAYTINSEASSISVINLNTHTVCATIQVGKYPDSFTTDGQFGFVNTTDKNTIYIIDLSDNMVIETLQSSRKYVSLNCTDTHLYAGLQKFIKLKKNGMRLFKYPYPGIEGMYNQDHNEAFSNFEEAALSKNYEKAKDYFDIAIALGNKKAMPSHSMLFATIYGAQNAMNSGKTNFFTVWISIIFPFLVMGKPIRMHLN